jgi:hypothetical protein
MNFLTISFKRMTCPFISGPASLIRFSHTPHHPIIFQQNPSIQCVKKETKKFAKNKRQYLSWLSRSFLTNMEDDWWLVPIKDNRGGWVISNCRRGLWRGEFLAWSACPTLTHLPRVAIPKKESIRDSRFFPPCVR